MVVDDMSTSRGLIVQALDSFGVRDVATAENGRNALQLLEKRQVHLVISDFNMPEMDGLQLLYSLRAKPRTTGIGFVLITGRSNQQIVDQGKKLGMNNYLEKPFKPQELCNCIEAVVGPL
jgi:two-component system chemotaxis response regulator CheY